jgi:anti-sigma factor RsiW
MNCRQVEETIADYVAGRLTPTEAVRVSAHLADCPTCADAEQRERAMRARFAAAPLVNTPDDLWMRLAPQLRNAPQPRFAWRRFAFPRLWITAPALTAAAAAVALLWFLPQPGIKDIDRGGRETGVQTPVPSTYPITSFVNDVRETGVRESEILLEETQAARQMGLAAAPEGGSL